MPKTWNFQSRVETKKIGEVVRTGKQLFALSFQKGKNRVSFNYVALNKPFYFVGSEERQSADLDTGKKYHWFPGFDDVNEKRVMIFNMSCL
jgi:hypothetical protein